MSLTKATIEVLDDEVVSSGRLPRFLDVQFNPTQYTRNKSAKIADIPILGIDSPILQFIRGDTEKLSLELFFDTTEEGMGEQARDVTELTEPFYQLVKIQAETHAVPRIRFIWGSFSFKAIVESVQQKLDLFNPLGMPLRATLSLTLREYKTLEEQLQELNLQTADHSKHYVTQQGDTLSRIAGKAYGDPGAWRHIADANDITSPRSLAPGQSLIIPPLDLFSQPLVRQS